MSHRLSLLGLAAATALLGACATNEPPAEPNVLVAAKVATPPVLDGDAGDAAWASARPVTLKLTDGRGFVGGATTATLKSVYSGDRVYFLIQYDDPTMSLRRAPYQKQADGSWKKLKDPDDKGGDNNIYYEDKWSIIWNIGNSIAKFDDRGCAVACHIGQGKPYGNKYTSKEGELGDIWHMKTGRSMPWGKVDDQYLDHTRHDPKTSPSAGRKNEPGGPDYKGFDLVDGKPQFMHKDGKAANAGGSYHIAAGDEVPFDDRRFKPGDEVASYIANRTTGDRADVDGRGRWANGKWTFEVSRKLVTGSKFDVQFDDLNASYGFGFAAFDNAQVQHAMADDPLKLRFAK